MFEHTVETRGSIWVGEVGKPETMCMMIGQLFIHGSPEALHEFACEIQSLVAQHVQKTTNLHQD